MSFFNTKSHKKSFSLPEISVVIAVLAFLTFTSVRSLQNVLNKTQTSVDKQKIKIVKQALQTYFDTYGHLPAPADYTLANNDANYGKSKTTKNDYDGILNGDFFYNANDDKGLPSEYKEVEYIESTGTQWIDTGVVPNNNMKFNVDMQFNETSSMNQQIGCGIADDSQRILITLVNSNFGCAIGTYYDNIFNITNDTKRHLFSIDLKNSQCQIDDVIKTVNNTFVGSTLSFTLFARHDGTSYRFQNVAKLYSSQIYENDQLIRDFIPCYRKSDGVIGLYDKAEGKFYTNHGSGTFLKGSDINNNNNSSTTQTSTNETLPNDYQKVEYIESTGTQWIDTNVKANLSTIVYTDIQYSNIDTNLNGYDATMSNRFQFGIYQNKWYFFYGATNNMDKLQSRFNADTNRHMIIYNIIDQTIKIDNNLVDLNNTNTNNTNKEIATIDSYSFAIFGRKYNSDTNVSAYTKAKLYRMKIEQNNQLVRDFIPCYRKSDGEIGLYDKVEGKFYTNQGSGTFLKGNDVNNIETETEIKNLNHNYTVYRGIVPFRELGLAEEDVVDSKGNFFEYYVPEIMTIPKDTTLSTIEDKTFIKNGYVIKKFDSDAPYSKYPCPAKKGDIPSSICTETTYNLFGVEIVKTEIKQYTKYEKMYQPVEYIESTGTQYIDTGIKPNSNTSVEIDMAIMNEIPNYSWSTVFGAGNDSYWFFLQSNKYGAYAPFDNKFSFTCGYNSDPYRAATSSEYVFGRKYHIKTSICSIQFDNSITNASSIGDFTIDKNMTIFALNNNGTILHHAYIRLYSFKITQNNSLVRYMVPVVRKSDNEIGLYDLVEGKFYTNQGSGEFLIGKKSSTSVPKDYKRIEYIDTNCSYNRNASSSNCPYIDTGVKTTTNGIGIDGKIVVGGTDNDDWQQIFGNRNADGKFGLWWYNGYSGLYWETDQQGSCKIASNNINHIDPFTIKITGNTFDINGYTTTCTNTNKNGITNLLLFDVNDTPESVRPMKLYYWKIYDGTTIIRDFIPCYRKSDGEIGLYDLVEEKFYTNQGSGTFLKGEDYIPEEYQEVEYIENTIDAPYIDTLVIPDKTTKVELDVMPIEFTNNTWNTLFGTRNCYSSNCYKYSLWAGTDGQPYASFGEKSDQYFGNDKLKTGNRYIINFDAVSGIKINGKDNSFSATYNDSISTNEISKSSLILFGINSNESGGQVAIRRTKQRIYSCTIWQNNQLVRDFTPCYRKSDGKIGLYDRVSKTFFINQGNGDFSTNYIDIEEPITTTIITTNKFNQPPYGLRIKNLKTEKDIEPNGSIAYLLLSHGEDGEKTCSIKRPTTIGQTPISINTLENVDKINATNKFEAQNCFNAVKQDTYNLVARNDFLTGTNKEYMFYKGQHNADFDDIVEYSTLAELIKGGAGVNY